MKRDPLLQSCNNRTCEFPVDWRRGWRLLATIKRTFPVWGFLLKAHSVPAHGLRFEPGETEWVIPTSLTPSKSSPFYWTEEKTEQKYLFLHSYFIGLYWKRTSSSPQLCRLLPKRFPASLLLANKCQSHNAGQQLSFPSFWNWLMSSFSSSSS